jgi:hypothetical protein
MKRTTWLTRVIAVFAAILVSLGIWTAVAGTAPGTSGSATTGTGVTNSNFNQNDDFLTRNPPQASQSTVPSQTTARYRTKAS